MVSLVYVIDVTRSIAFPLNTRLFAGAARVCLRLIHSNEKCFIN